MKVTVFKNIFDKHHPMYFDIITVFRRIKEGGETKSKIESIRLEKDKSKRDEIKKRLPSICFSGKFSQRGEKYLLEHSGLICLDIDSIIEKDMGQIKSTLESEDYTMACFVSPSGNGYKVIVKVPPEQAEHKGLFLALEKFYNQKLNRFISGKKNLREIKGGKTGKIDESQGTYLRVNIDKSGKDVSRVCYESYDPFIYQNPDSEVWAEVLTEKVRKKSITDQDRILEMLKVWVDNKEGYHEGNRNTYMYQFLYSTCRFGVEPYRVKEYVSKEFPQFPLKDLAAMTKSCYASEDFGSQEFTEEDFVRHKKHLSVKIKNNKKVVNFWNINDKGKVKIDTKTFLEFVEAQGFGIYRHKETADVWDFVREVDMIVDVVGIVDIKKMVLAYVEENAPEPVFDEFQMVNRYFDKSFLNALPEINVQQVRDRSDCSYIFFQKFYYEITATEKVKKNYLDLDGVHIWRKQICKKEITEIVDYKSKGFNFTEFLYKAMGGSVEKYLNACSAIGYSIHTYKKFRLAKLIYAFEASFGELDGMACGGSGKNLMQMCLEYVRAVEYIDGKELDKKDKFKFQNVTVDTQLVIIDDYEGDIKELFTKVTGHFAIEKKGLKKTTVPFKESPKILVSSNNAPKGFSASFARRLHLLEFSNHYNDIHTPADEFGDSDFFGDDWGQDDFNMLYSFLFDCVQIYQKQGLMETSSLDLKEKQLIHNTGRNFAEFWLYYTDIDMGEFQNARSLMIDYKEQMSDTDINEQNFYRSMRKMCVLYGWNYVSIGTGVKRKICFKEFVSIKKDF